MVNASLQIMSVHEAVPVPTFYARQKPEVPNLFRLLGNSRENLLFHRVNDLAYEYG
jgi:hypothetical protein